MLYKEENQNNSDIPITSNSELEKTRSKVIEKKALELSNKK